MESSLNEYKELARNKVADALNSNNYDELFTLLGYIKSGEKIEEMDEDKLRDKRAHCFYKLGMLYNQMTDKEKRFARFFGIKKDINKAIECLLKSFALGNDYALSPLYSIFTKIDEPEKAEQILAMGIHIEQPKMCYLMGLRYYRVGEYEKAYPLLKTAYDQAPQYGGYELGVMYEDGLGVEKNEEEAFYCFLDAADCGDKMAMNKVGFLYRDLGQADNAKYYLQESIKAGIGGKRKEEASEVIREIEEFSR